MLIALYWSWEWLSHLACTHMQRKSHCTALSSSTHCLLHFAHISCVKQKDIICQGGLHSRSSRCVHACACVCVSACVCVYMCVCVHVYMHVCVFVCMCICICVCVFDDPRIRQGKNVPDDYDGLLTQSVTRQKGITLWWFAIQVQVWICTYNHRDFWSHKNQHTIVYSASNK